MEYADLKGGETVLDLYCGVGMIGLFAAKEMEDKGRVIGIESVKPAVIDANRNSVINGMVSTRYLTGKAEDILPAIMGIKPFMGYNEVNELVEKEPPLTVDHADVVFLDPPRAGCEEELLSAVVQAEPDRIVYVSCDPATLARDIKYLTENGYDFKEATPVDMFPHTGHVETVCCLYHQKKDFISVPYEPKNDGYLK
jgi:23S rRNA (uracil1939-C5)-methyltransferase